MDSYDVVIVGAGPAGLNCAKHFGKTGMSVLLLEKNSVIGPKVCAGGLTLKGINYLKLPESLKHFASKKVKVHVKNKTSILRSKKTIICTIDRCELGQWQLKQLKKYPNIQVKTNSKVSSIGKDHVMVTKKKIRFKYLIGADGSSSFVKNHLGIKSKKGPSFQYIVNGKKNDLEIFMDSKYFSNWYAWIFPRGDKYTVGTGCDPNVIAISRLKKNFMKWCKKNDIDLTKAKYEAFPIDSDYRGHIFGNIFLIGDAAGLASCITGEGIYQALISGEEIVKTILNPKYHSKVLDTIIRTKQRHHKMLTILNHAGPFRNLFFSIGVFLLKIKRFRRRADLY